MSGPDVTALLEAVAVGHADPVAAWRELAAAGTAVRAGIEALREAVAVLDEAGPWAALGAVPLGLELGVPPGEVAGSALEALLPPLSAARVRVRLAARGWRETSGGTLTGPGGARLAVRPGLLPRGWGRVPVLPFLEGTAPVGGDVLRVPVPPPPAAWAAEALRLGVERLAGGGGTRLRAARLAWLAARVPAAERERWLGRLGLWGARRLAAWAIGGGARPSGGRVRAGARLQDGVGGAVRFVLAQALGGDDPAWA